MNNKQTPYEEGVQAEREDEYQAECPYPEDSPEAKEFWLGYGHSIDARETD